MAYVDQPISIETLPEFKEYELPLQTKLAETAMSLIGSGATEISVRGKADGPFPAAEIRIQQGEIQEHTKPFALFYFSSRYTWESILQAKKDISLIQEGQTDKGRVKTEDYIYKNDAGDLVRTRKTSGIDNLGLVSEITKPARPETILAMARLAAIRINTSSKAKQPATVA